MKVDIEMTSPFLVEVLKNIGAKLLTNQRGNRVSNASMYDIITVDIPVGWTKEQLDFHANNIAKMATRPFKLEY